MLTETNLRHKALKTMVATCLIDQLPETTQFPTEVEEIIKPCFDSPAAFIRYAAVESFTSILSIIYDLPEDVLDGMINSIIKLATDHVPRVSGCAL